MKNIFIALLAVFTLSIALTYPILAGGDQVRGGNGEGTVNQVQVMDPLPFQDP